MVNGARLCVALKSIINCLRSNLGSIPGQAILVKNREHLLMRFFIAKQVIILAWKATLRLEDIRRYI